MPTCYFLKQLLLLPGGLLLLLFFALWWHISRPRSAWLCGVCGSLGLWLMSMPFNVGWMGRWPENEPALSAEDLPGLVQRADAIVTLGADQQTNDPAWDDDTPSLLTAERLRYTAWLARASMLPVLINGGLHYRRLPSEAALMANALLQDFGVPTHQQEGLSRTTWGNATLSTPRLREADVCRTMLAIQA